MIVDERPDWQARPPTWQNSNVARPLPPPSAQPFTVPARGEVRGLALCIHGYTGTPFEVLPLALALADVGVTSTGVVLPGHEGGKDGDPAVHNRTTWRDWERGALDAFDALSADASPAVPRVVAGSSMGALVALRLAIARPAEIAALVLLAPAFRFYAEGRFAAAASARGLWRLMPYVNKDRGSDVADDDGRRLNPCLTVLPLRGIGELAEMQRAVARDLARVRAPVCVFHGAQDHTIPPAASEEIARGVSSARVEHHVLRDSFHVIGIDVDRDQVGALAASFVDEALRTAPAAVP